MCAINGLYRYRPTALAVDLAELCATCDHMAAGALGHATATARAAPRK